MESHEIFVPRTSKVPVHFQLIPFVSASDESSNIFKESNNEKNISNCKLNGEEVSCFYREVISSPPSCLASPTESVQDYKVETKNKNSLLCNSRLTIFHFAQNGDIEGVGRSLSKRCDVDVQDMYGWTPLMCATFEGHYTVAEYLLKKGAKLDIKNKQGLTSLDIAIKKNHGALIELLKNGIIDKTAHSKVEMKDEIKYCNLCNCSYVESPAVHERSIAHLFSSKNSNTTTFYYIPENNKGFQIMLKEGWDKNNGLGINADGRKFPVKTVLKTDRMCIGRKKEIPKITHFGPNDYQSIKAINQPSLNLKKEKRFKKWKMKKLENKNRQLEIEFRRQFHLE